MTDPAEVDLLQLHRFLGAVPTRDGVRVTVWSPTSDEVRVICGDRVAATLARLDSGYHAGIVDKLSIGDGYQLSFDGRPPIPDPASRAQRDSVHGDSVVVDPAFDWTDGDWRPPAIEDWVIYELHVGTVTDGGTFTSLIERLDELVALGVTAIELMPVADCAGGWNWGYDGVHLFAPNRNYGSPADMRRLVDAAHAKGLAVVLDVVYNHLGPEGNYLGAAGPYLSSRHQTVWGDAPNFDDPVNGDQCRRWFIANAVYWLDEFHIDALRVDAVHCIVDTRRPHVASEFAAAVDRMNQSSDRPSSTPHKFLIAESNVYDPEMIRPADRGGIGFDAAWSDDFVHSLYACLMPGVNLSDRDYRPGDDLRQVLTTGYVYTGTLDQFRRRDDPVDPVPTDRLVRCVQNHDFIGNHPTGRRLATLTDRSTAASAAALMILSPSIPMLFMGEEFACENPFAFFVDFSDASLRQSVIDGRRREYPQHDWSTGILPTDREAMTGSRIGPITDRAMWHWYQSLIRLRKSWQTAGVLGAGYHAECDPAAGRFSIRYAGGGVTVGLRRFGDQPRDAPERSMAGLTDRGTIVLDSGEVFGGGKGDSWAVVWSAADQTTPSDALSRRPDG